MEKNCRTYSRDSTRTYPREIKRFKNTVMDSDTSDQSVDEITIPNTSELRYNNRTFVIDANAKRSLDDRGMLNDTIVEFYTNYLLHKTMNRDKFHLFNTFFYNSLKKALKPAIDGDNDEVPSAFKQTARRWDKDVRIFEKDYLVIPICEHEHWNLVIVCFANRCNPLEKRPLVILFDSLGYRYNFASITTPIRKFLSIRWGYERTNELPRDFTKKSIIADVCAKVPRQKNSYDCGIYMLNAFEKFLQSPITLYDLIRCEQDVTNQFKVDAKQKRNEILSLVLQDNDVCDIQAQ